MQKRYPFKFLDAYTREDSDFYFGRTDEIDALYEMVFQTDLLLVYGASGTGKSSLIQCGLASKFQSHDWLALNIRRIGDLNESFEKALHDAGGTLDPDTADNFDWLDEDPEQSAPAKPVSDLARRFKAIYLKHFKPVYLIFDQFEELYILGTRDEQQQFVETVQEILRVEQPVKIILSIREEYLGHLYEFERAVPELLRKKLRVEPMNLDKVKTVIQSVGAQPTGNVRLQAGEEDALAEAIFEKIRGEEKTLHIPLPYLQVFLDKLYLQITDDKTRQAEAVFSMQALSKIGDLGDVLRNFLDEQVRDIAPELGQPQEMLWQTLSPFVTLDGTKEPLSEAQLADKLPDADADFVRRALQAFVKGRILRFSEATQRYEIAHDSLARQIHAKRSDEEIAILEVQRLVKSQTAMKAAAREFFTEKQLLFMEPYLAKFNPSAEESDWIARSRAEVLAQKEAAALRQAEELENARTRAVEAERLTNAAEQGRKRARMFSYLAGAVAAVAIGIGFYAISQKTIADKQTERANTEASNTQTALDKVEQQQKETIAALAQATYSDSVAQDKTVKTLLAQKDTKKALDDLKITSDQAVTILLAEIDRNILHLEYDSTFRKCQTAINLQAQRSAVEERIWEIAYFYTEADTAAAAIPFLNLLKSTGLSANAPDLQRKTRTYLANALPTTFLNAMEERYFPKLIPVEGGSFLREDSVRVTVSRFKMAETETTFWQYNVFAKATHHYIERPSWQFSGDNPAVNVSWFDAAFYLNWLSDRKNLRPVYVLTPNGEKNYAGNDLYDVTIDSLPQGFRLPTEAEWEFAARGGNRSKDFAYSGDSVLTRVAWFSDNSNSRTQAVKKKNPNELGLYDMSGNVWEWCRDWYDYGYDENAILDPKGPEMGDNRVDRGGGWFHNAENCRVSYRSYNTPAYRDIDLSFRLSLQ